MSLHDPVVLRCAFFSCSRPCAIAALFMPARLYWVYLCDDRVLYGTRWAEYWEV
jgi:hypothetical protein